MTEKTSPFVDSKYGWEYGENGWNTGADENFIKFGYLHDANVDEIVTSLPPVVEGAAYFNTQDSRIYYVVDNTYYSTPVPKWFIFNIRLTGDKYQFDGVTITKILSPSEVSSTVEGLSTTVEALGTAAFRDASYFASQEDLQLSEDRSKSYTDIALSGISPSFENRQAVELSAISPSIKTLDIKSFTSGGIGGAKYGRFELDQLAEAIVAKINSASATPLSKRREWAINNAVTRLRASGLLAVGKLGALIDLGGAGQAEQAAALVDWIQPDLVTPVAGGGAITYIPGKGMKFDGTSYVTVSANFGSIPGVTLDSAHAGVFVVGTGAEDYVVNNDRPMIGGGSRLGVSPCNLLGGMSVALNTNTPVAVGRYVVGRAGHSIANRVSGAAVQAYRDGELCGEAASAVQSVSGSPVIVGGWATPNLFSTDTVGFAHFGGSLNIAEAQALYEILTEYRHLILSDANPGALIQSADGAWWALPRGAEARNPYQYGADEVDDTQAFRDMCSIQQDVFIPKPKQSFRVTDECKVLARVVADGSRIRMTVVTPNSRCFDLQDRSRFVGAVIDHHVVTTVAPSEGGQHCCVLLGRFHGTQTPVRDVEVDVKINVIALVPAAVYVIGNVKRPKITYDVSGPNINGAAFLAHWGSQIDPVTLLEHTIQRPRNGHLVSGVGRSLVTSGHRGFYFSGVADWRVDKLEAHNFRAPMGVAPGDKQNFWDAACYNETAGRLLADLSFGDVKLIDPAGTACRLWGRTSVIGGPRWYSTDLDSNSSIKIENLQITRGRNTVQAGDEAIMLDIDIGANIDIKLNITSAPETPLATLQILQPLIRVNGGRNVKLRGRAVGRVGTRLLSGVNLDVAIDAENPIATETSSASAGVWLESETVTGTLTAPVAIGDTSISFVRSPATHIVPGMQFDYSGTRFTFASSQAGDNLLDDNVTMKIEPAPAAIPSAALVVVLGGASDVKLHGSEQNFYRSLVSSGSDIRVPNGVHVVSNMHRSWDDHVELDCGTGFYFDGGVMDRGNRRNDSAARDLRINAAVRDVHITGVRFSPSPGSRLTVNHIYANPATSGIIARDNYGYGVAGGGAMFSIPATGADGKPNVNSNFEG